jgi:tRNA 2-thiouridine synthesizing protein A
VDTTITDTTVAETAVEASSAPTIDHTVDARGQSCPGPIVSLARALKEVGSGAVLEVLATDPGSKTDIPAWAKISGNELLEQGEDAGVYRYVVRKR